MEKLYPCGVSRQFYFRRVRKTGEFRPPKKGEWYLSGAKPQGYRAPNDLSTSYHICELVKQTTGRSESKLYRCQSCGHESQHNTNHYGQFYDRCPKCSWKSPMSPIKTHECMEPLPEGWAKTDDWKMVKLGDLVAERN